MPGILLQCGKLFLEDCLCDLGIKSGTTGVRARRETADGPVGRDSRPLRDTVRKPLGPRLTPRDRFVIHNLFLAYSTSQNTRSVCLKVVFIV